jgi:hypothetical protein
MTRRFHPSALVLALLVPLVACEAKKSETPLSPTVAGPIAGVEITAPRLLEPSEGTKLKESQQPITLLVENSSTNGVRPIAYTFEVATDSSFEVKMYARSGVLPGSDGRTRVTVDRLESGRSYHWRVRADDGANSSVYSVANFELLPKPQLDPPPAISPINNAQTATRSPQLVVGASTRNAAVTSVVYEFQLASDAAFTAMVATGIRTEDGGSTAFGIGGDLAASTTYFWRARAIESDVTSGWSTIHSFRTPAAAGPSPGPSPGPAPGGPCNSSSPQSIVECERAKYGHMDRGQTVEFLRAVARSLNRNGIGGGPYGILRKAGGNQCGGYSCDIICAGQGTGQRQHDVLSDWDGPQGPVWGSAHTWPNIRVDVCEIQ